MIDRLIESMIGWPRPLKRTLQVSFDTVALVFAVWLAFKIRFGMSFMPSLSQFALFAAAPATAIPVFARMGLYRAILRYLTDRALWTIVQAMTLATLLWVLVVFLTEMNGGDGAPRSVPFLYWLIGIVILAGSRFLARSALSRFNDRHEIKTRTLIYGAGTAGAQLANALRSAGERRVLGFVDDDPALQGMDVVGLRVHKPDDLPQLVANKGVDEVVLSVPRASATRRLEIASMLANFPVKLRVLPAIADLAAGRYAVGKIKEIGIEDLLGRTRVEPHPGLMGSVLRNQHIMVTGAGGSIGSELCRLVARHAPASLTLVDASEAALYEIDRQLRRDVPGLVCKPVLRSVASKQGVRDLFADRKIDTVFHAAAYKHVPLVEENPIEAIRNNLLGTYYMAEAAQAAGVARFGLISTDKAVRPISVMGATKRWSELVVRHFADIAECEVTGQRFFSVRFGNVLGSTGSVVPLFEEQIARGGPVTLTDERMTRYFMAVQEAVELIVQSAALSKGGEIFLLDMGAPVPIRALAENMIRLAGLALKSPEHPDGDIEIEAVGIRPGEKLHEDLYYEPSLVEATSHAKIMRAKRRVQNREPIEIALRRLGAALDANDAQKARAILFERIEAGSVPSESEPLTHERSA